MSGVLNLLLAGAASAIKDAYFNLTTLLLNTSSTNGAQNNTFLDSSTNNFTITRNGNTTQGTFTPFSQTGWSNYFNGSSTISFGTSSATNILAYDTFECWVNMPVIGTNDLIAGKDGNFWMGYNFTGIGGTANKFVFSIWTGSSWQAVSSTTTPVVGVWYHLLGVKDNTTMRFYVNGVQENTSTFSGSPVTTGTFYVASNNNIENFEGYISNLRLITGASNTVFPYSGLTTGSSFTPPTSALTAVTGTALLTCQSNRFVDNSSNNLSATIISIPSVQAFSPFAPTAAYSTSVVGGSGYFDGTGDFLSTSSNAAFAFGTGDFEVDFWIYATSLPASDNNILNQNLASGTPQFYIDSTGKLQYRNAFVGSVLTSNTTFKTGQWYYCVISRVSGTSRMFINGALDTSGSDSTDWSNTAGWYVSNSSGSFTGYISNVRLVKGSGITSSTVPTAPLTAITNTVLLVSATNAGIFDSAAKNDLETGGNAQVSTTQAKWGTTSMYFDGTGDYMNGAAFSNPLRAFGTGDFTIEGWFYTSSNKTQIILDTGTTSGSGSGMQIALNSSGYPYFYIFNSTTITSSIVVSLGTWTHVAWVRSNGVAAIYVNGVSGVSTANTSNITDTGLTIGTPNDYRDTSSTYHYDGYIDDLRITRGLARYVANFSVPTAAFPLQ